MRLGIKEIEQILPHRHPFLLVDYIEEMEPGVSAVGYKCVTFHEAFFSWTFSTGTGYARGSYSRGISAGEPLRFFL